MLIDRLNLNHMRIFECVYKTGSMTLAAQELHLTQSGVSQHMKSLEDVLGVQLFDRVKQKLVPTRMATELYERCTKGLGEIEGALSKILGGNEAPSGVVAIGMPVEFGNNVVVPAAAELSKKYPLVHFKFRYEYATVVNAMLLKGELDFAFVDEFRMDPAIEKEKVFDEILELCVSSERLAELGTYRNVRKFYEQLEYVDYQEGEPLLRMWFGHHLGTQSLDLNVRATLMDVQGVARMVKSGAGAGILPDHLIQKLEGEGKKLHRFRGCGTPLKNSISVAYLQGRTQSRAAELTLAALKASMKSASALLTKKK